MSVVYEAVSDRRDPISCTTARLGGLLAREDVQPVRATVHAALVEQRSLVLDLTELRLQQPTWVKLFSDALTAAGGWPSCRLALFGAQERVAAALRATGVEREVPVAADLDSAAARLCPRPDRVTRRLHLRPGPTATRRACTFTERAGRAWQVKRRIREAAALAATQLTTCAVLHSKSPGILTVALDESGLYIAVRNFDRHRRHEPVPLDRGDVRSSLLDSGLIRRSDGTVVWALLALDRRW